MKEYKFTITEQWSQDFTFTAETLEDAKDLAQEFQDNFDIDPTKAQYKSGSIIYSGED